MSWKVEYVCGEWYVVRGDGWNQVRKGPFRTYRSAAMRAQLLNTAQWKYR